MGDSITDVKNGLDEALTRVSRHKDRIVLKRRGKKVAALVPLEDLKLLEKLEEEDDIREAKKALDEYKRTGRSIPLAEVKKRLGLK